MQWEKVMQIFYFNPAKAQSFLHDKVLGRIIEYKDESISLLLNPVFSLSKLTISAMMWSQSVTWYLLTIFKLKKNHFNMYLQVMKNVRNKLHFENSYLEMFSLYVILLPKMTCETKKFLIFSHWVTWKHNLLTCWKCS